MYIKNKLKKKTPYIVFIRIMTLFKIRNSSFYSSSIIIRNNPTKIKKENLKKKTLSNLKKYIKHKNKNQIK